VIRCPRRALELESALAVLSSFDEGPDLVLYFKHMMVLKGDKEYTLHFNETDALSDSQRGYVEAQLKLFDSWYASGASCRAPCRPTRPPEGLLKPVHSTKGLPP
jgi:hypothetical protein